MQLRRAYAEPMQPMQPMQPMPSDAVPSDVAGEPAEPTPWATGLAVSVFITVLVLIGDVALTRTVKVAFGWLWIPANLLVGVGLAPSIWLLRTVPFWRWIAYGVAIGLALAWTGLLIGVFLGARR